MVKFRITYKYSKDPDSPEYVTTEEVAGAKTPRDANEKLRNQQSFPELASGLLGGYIQIIRIERLEPDAQNKVI
jgi:hypothetical protein